MKYTWPRSAASGPPPTALVMYVVDYLHVQVKLTEQDGEYPF